MLAIFKKEKNIYGKVAYTERFSDFVEDDFIQHEKSQLMNERRNDLMNALAELTQKKRDIVVMKFFDNLKSKQIAEKLHVTVGNVDNDSTRAYKELRTILQSKFSFQQS